LKLTLRWWCSGIKPRLLWLDKLDKCSYKGILDAHPLVVETALGWQVAAM
jgi:hypothetical protein